MEGGGAASVSAEKASESAEAASYTYWIREMTHEAAPLPVPRKLNPEDLSNESNRTHLGSAWNGINVKLSEDKDLPQEDKQQICRDLKLFLQPLWEKLLQFEQELKGR
ncbi:Aha1 N domain-containing protein [Abeliophyllum distichum]|uniref:Aha1 N domain-containing protein n=1 Tax=Abeliophyllum distichum TaxID=126358 RepID=A0ABD1R0B6_9LAMI